MTEPLNNSVPVLGDVSLNNSVPVPDDVPLNNSEPVLDDVPLNRSAAGGPSGPAAATTLADVAREAGVSTSAVSRTFTPGASVGKKTRARVLEAANRLGYRPNAIARTLSTRKSRMVGLVVSYLDNQFYPTVIEQLSHLLQQHGYHVLLFIGRDNGPDMDSVLLEILQYQVDAIVLASTMLSSGLAAHCRAAGIPVVLFNRTAPVAGVSTVASANEEGGRLAADYLLRTGARRIAFMAGLDDASTSQERERGFMAALQRAGVALTARCVGQYSLDEARVVTRELYEEARPDTWPDAWFVANDHMAFGVLDALRTDLKLRVPDDVQVIGFDNVPQAAWGGYQLTTVEQDSWRMAQATVALLMRQFDPNHPAHPEQVVIPVKLIERATTLGV